MEEGGFSESADEGNIVDRRGYAAFMRRNRFRERGIRSALRFGATLIASAGFMKRRYIAAGIIAVVCLSGLSVLAVANSDGRSVPKQETTSQTLPPGTTAPPLQTATTTIIEERIATSRPTPKRTTTTTTTTVAPTNTTATAITSLNGYALCKAEDPYGKGCWYPADPTTTTTGPPAGGDSACGPSQCLP